MSIVPLVKVTAYGLLGEKAEVLDELQEIGCLHLVPLEASAEAGEELAPSPQARQALKFLLASPQQRQQIHNPEKFDALEVQRRALEIQAGIQTLEDRRDFLRRRIADLEPWGEFHLPPRQDLAQQRLWFYIVPHYQMAKVAETDLIWQVVHRTNRFVYVVVLSEGPPTGMPVERTRTGYRPLSLLRRDLEEIESAIEEEQVERWRLTCWLNLFAGSVDRLEEQSERAFAARETFDDDPLFALQAWAPAESVERLRGYATEKGLALVVEAPGPDAAPPTLLRNPEPLQGGQSLVSFYMTPGYRLWDPSRIVYFSFALFFAMILSDAGYALLLGLPLLWKWRALSDTPARRGLRNLWGLLAGSSIAWGVMAGSYFGVAPSAGSALAAAKLFEVTDSATMMRFSIAIGLAHVALANAIDAWRRRRSWAALAPLGWLTALLGAGAWFLGTGTGWEKAAATAGPWAMAAGGAAVLLFTGTEGSPLKRLLAGLMAIPRISNAFGDVLSYLRLFALGLASASLAMAFNGLAAQVADAPAFGKLLQLLVLLFGHGLNFLLALVSGFVHGLRLNFIEFFNWSVPEEGIPFRAFAKKEAIKWSR